MNTEKSTNILAYNQYMFKIHLLSNKSSVKKAIEKEFSVEVGHVNLLNRKGKFKQRGKILGKQRNWKKAYVTLKPGFTINFDAKTKKD